MTLQSIPPIRTFQIIVVSTMFTREEYRIMTKTVKKNTFIQMVLITYRCFIAVNYFQYTSILSHIHMDFVCT